MKPLLFSVRGQIRFLSVPHSLILLITVVACSLIAGCGQDDATESHERVLASAARRYSKALGNRSGPPASSLFPDGLRTPFVPNLGQWSDETVDYYAQFSSSLELGADSSGWRVAFRQAKERSPRPTQQGQGSLLALLTGPTFGLSDIGTGQHRKDDAGQEPTGVLLRYTLRVDGDVPSLSPGPRMPGCYNYFRGNNPEMWKTQVPLYDGIIYSTDKVELHIAERNGALLYRIKTEPGFSLSHVSIQVQGADTMFLSGNGELVTKTAVGAIVQSAPPGWQFDIQDSRTFGFRRSPIHTSAATALVDDTSILEFSTLWGGGHIDEVHAMSEHSPGIVTTAGITTGTLVAEDSFPTSPGAFLWFHVPFTSANGLNNWPVTHHQSGRDVDGFVTRMRIAPPPGHVGPYTAELLFSTFLGGHGNDYLEAVDVTSTGLITVGGYAEHNPFVPSAPNHDYPLTADAVQTLLHDTWGDSVNKFAFREGILTQLDPTKTLNEQLVYSTYYGGTYHDDIRSVVAQGPKSITFSGVTSSHDLPGVGSYSFDPLLGIDGTPKLVGTTDVITIEYDGFVSRIAPSGTGGTPVIQFATYLGHGYTFGTFDMINDMRVDGNIITVVGRTDSLAFPITTTAIQSGLESSANPWHWDAFVTQLELGSTQMNLLFSTYLGGDVFDIAEGVDIDPRTGWIYVVGNTNSAHIKEWEPFPGCVCNPPWVPFPTTPGAFDTQLNFLTSGWLPHNCVGEYFLDAFVTIIDTTPPHIVASTYLGGYFDEIATDIDVAPNGLVTITGWTFSGNPLYGLPTTENAYAEQLDVGGHVIYDLCETIPAAPADVFITRFDKDLSQVLFSTYFGAKQDDFVRDLIATDKNLITFAGHTYSNAVGNLAYPTFDGADAFPTTPDAYSSQYSDEQAAWGLHVNNYVNNAGFNLGENYIAVLDASTVGTNRYGASSGSCGGNAVVDVMRVPRTNDSAFAFSCVNAPTTAPGYLLVSTIGKLSPPIQVLGVDVYVNNPIIFNAVPSDGYGISITPVPTTGIPVGTHLWSQFVFSCGTGFEGSDALEIQIQP